MFFVEKVYKNANSFSSSAQNSPLNNTINSSSINNNNSGQQQQLTHMGNNTQRNYFSAERAHRTIETASIYTNSNHTNPPHSANNHGQNNYKHLNETISVLQGGNINMRNNSPKAAASTISITSNIAGGGTSHSLDSKGSKNRQINNQKNFGNPHQQQLHALNNGFLSGNNNNNLFIEKGQSHQLPLAPSTAVPSDRKQLRQNFMDVDQILN